VLIDNKTYFIDMQQLYFRDDSKITCESMNMTLIRFEGDQQKWIAVNDWIVSNGMQTQNQYHPGPYFCILKAAKMR
jgi:hypothetical protein